MPFVSFTATNPRVGVVFAGTDPLPAPDEEIRPIPAVDES